jgi:hypothetical protein
MALKPALSLAVRAVHRGLGNGLSSRAAPVAVATVEPVPLVTQGQRSLPETPYQIAGIWNVRASLSDACFRIRQSVVQPVTVPPSS